MKQLLIKLGLWEEPKDYGSVTRSFYEASTDKVSVDAGWYQVALKHYCDACERWFEKVQGKMMHDRHRHA